MSSRRHKSTTNAAGIRKHIETDPNRKKPPAYSDPVGVFGNRLYRAGRPNPLAQFMNNLERWA